MTRTSSMLARLAVAAATGFMVLFAADRTPLNNPGLVTTADARIGRPLTPMSYAGVARRTTRRAVAVGAAATAGAAVYAAPVVVAPSCYQAVDAYGRVYTRCP